MKNVDYLALVIVAVSVVLIGVIAFSGNGSGADLGPSTDDDPQGFELQRCIFEKLNQVIEFDGLQGISGQGIRNYTKNLHVPSDNNYKDVKVLSGRVNGGCSYSPSQEMVVNCSLLINDVLCLENFFDPDHPADRPIGFVADHELPPECINALSGGANKITLQNSVEPSGSIRRIFLEMEVKPANC